jgi:hypothetical protein
MVPAGPYECSSVDRDREPPSRLARDTDVWEAVREEPTMLA